jgi:hypothetical protein
MVYIFEILKKEELEELCNLIKLVFKRDSNYVISKTKWAFANDHSSVLVAKYNGAIVACRGGFDWPLKFNDSFIKAIQFHGTCVHPDHRRNGLFSKLNIKYIEDVGNKNVECIFNVSVDVSRLGYEKLGWEYMDGFHRLTHFNKPLKFVSDRFVKKNNVRKGTPNTFTLEPIPSAFLAARKLQFPDVVCTHYDQEFLTWRLNNKEENYRVFKNDEVYVVYKIIETNSLKSVVFGEFFMLRKSQNDFSKALFEIMNNENPDITYTYISRSHPYFRYYISCLFLPNPFNFNLNLGVRAIKNRDLTNKKWAISFLDIDTF